MNIFILEDKPSNYQKIRKSIRGDENDHQIFPSDTDLWHIENVVTEVFPNNDYNLSEFEYIQDVFINYNSTEDDSLNKDNIEEFFKLLLSKYESIDIFLIDADLATDDKFGILFYNFLKQSNYKYKKAFIISSTSHIDLNINEREHISKGFLDNQLIPKISK